MSTECPSLQPTSGGAAGRIPTLDFLMEIRRLADELGHTPSRKEMNEHGSYSSKPCQRDDLGSWNTAIWAAGLDPFRQDKTSTKELRDELLKLAVKLNKTPTASEMDEYGPYSSRTYIDRDVFGSWNGALEYAGLDPNRRTGKKRPSATGKGTRYTVVRRNATTIAKLPDPLCDGPWFRSGEHDLSQSLLQKLLSAELIWRKKDNTNVRWWRLKPHIYEVAVEQAEKTVSLPCGHAGVRNVPNGGYECSRCGSPCTRGQARAALSQSARTDGGES